MCDAGGGTAARRLPCAAPRFRPGLGRIGGTGRRSSDAGVGRSRRRAGGPRRAVRARRAGRRSPGRRRRRTGRRGGPTCGPPATAPTARPRRARDGPGVAPVRPAGRPAASRAGGVDRAVRGLGRDPHEPGPQAPGRCAGLRRPLGHLERAGLARHAAVICCITSSTSSARAPASSISSRPTSRSSSSSPSATSRRRASSCRASGTARPAPRHPCRCCGYDRRSRR